MEQKVVTVMQRVCWPNSKNGNTLAYDFTPHIQKELEQGWDVGSVNITVSDGHKQAILTAAYILCRD